MTVETRPAPPALPRSAPGAAETLPPGGPGRSPILDVLAVLLRWRRVVLGFAAGVLAVTLVWVLVTPPTFKARTSLLPKQEEGGLGGLTSLLSSQVGNIVGGLGGSTTSNDVLMTILESRFLRERLIERLHLIEALKIKAPTPERAREVALARLERMITLGMTKRLSIFVEVAAPTPQLAADLANGCFEELDRLNQDFSLQSARQRRRFFEVRLKESADSLGTAQARLVDFQRERGMIAMDEQAKAAVEVAARLQGELISLESQLEVQQKYFTGTFSRSRELQYRITALKNRLGELSGQRVVSGRDSSGMFISLRQMPGLGSELARLMLAVKTQEAVFGLLTAEFQQARIDEARDVPTVQVLDPARPPVFRAAPRRKQSLLAGLLAGFGGGLLLAFGCEYLERALAGVSGERLRGLGGPGVGRVEAWLRRLRSGASG